MGSRYLSILGHFVLCTNRNQFSGLFAHFTRLKYKRQIFLLQRKLKKEVTYCQEQKCKFKSQFTRLKGGFKY